ncbi:MAG: RibD family protein, partial [Sedimentisphaerales bacterium]|nr:RibD family protein [Sedimentisphaerales bacterium]
SSWQPRRVVLDSHLRIPLESQLVRTVNKAPLEIYTLQRTIDQQWQKIDALDECDCQVRAAPEKDGRLDPKAVLKDLGQLGVTDVLVEGGATILKTFRQQELADRIMVYIAPVIIGDKNVPAITFTDTIARLKNVSIEQFAGDVLIEGDLV